MSGARRGAHTGVLLVDKEPGQTSHDVVQAVRRIFGQREVGHTGTLDPMATGLLVLTLGKATRIARFLEAEDKRYLATVTLGRATTTFDREGETTETTTVPPLGDEEVERALDACRGRRSQVVPAFSAVKVQGERLYAKARRGEAVSAPARTVEIFALSATRVELPEINLTAHVSKGTYIRSLAVEIGQALRLPAHLSALRRTAVGALRVEDARPLAALTGAAAELIDLPRALGALPRLAVAGRALEDVRQGRPLDVATVRAAGLLLYADEPVMLLDPEGQLAAVAWACPAWADPAASASDRGLRYACVLLPSDSGSERC